MTEIKKNALQLFDPKQSCNKFLFVLSIRKGQVYICTLVINLFLAVLLFYGKKNIWNKLVDNKWTQLLLVIIKQKKCTRCDASEQMSHKYLAFCWCVPKFYTDPSTSNYAGCILQFELIQIYFNHLHAFSMQMEVICLDKIMDENLFHLPSHGPFT